MQKVSVCAPRAVRPVVDFLKGGGSSIFLCVERTRKLRNHAHFGEKSHPF